MILDLHGYSVPVAKKMIEQTIAKMSKGSQELIIVHGYHKGDEIRELVRDRFSIRSKRIVRRKYTKNQGETILVLE